ncbi:MAG: peptidylprolyl isomerase [Acidimicrobiia bacterium]
MRYPVRKTVLVAAALAAAGCGGGGQIVATVEGVDITLGEMEELRDSDSGSLAREEMAEDLGNLVIATVITETARQQFDIAPSAEEIDTRLTELIEQVEAGGQDFEAILADQGRTQEWARTIAALQLIQERVQEALTTDLPPVDEAAIQAAFDERPFEQTTVCSQHILVATEEEAAAALARIEGGEAFQDVAMDVGTDGTAEAGGDLGCVPASQFVGEFAQATLTAPLDEVTGPVHSQFGYHVILVTDRQPRELDDEARGRLEGQLELERNTEMQQRWQDWFLEAVRAAEVTVDEQYGRWTTEPVPQVLPPQ